MPNHIRIDPEFQSLIPALSADEFSQLEDNLLTERRCRDPLVVWTEGGHAILLDGHNRRQICERHRIP